MTRNWGGVLAMMDTPYIGPVRAGDRFTLKVTGRQGSPPRPFVWAFDNGVVELRIYGGSDQTIYFVPLDELRFCDRVANDAGRVLIPERVGVDPGFLREYDRRQLSEFAVVKR